jgi:hypothetical protein
MMRTSLKTTHHAAKKMALIYLLIHYINKSELDNNRSNSRSKTLKKILYT